MANVPGSPFVINVPLNANYESAPQLVYGSTGYAVQLKFLSGTCDFTASIEASGDNFSSPYPAAIIPVPPMTFDTVLDSPQSFAVPGTFTYNIRDSKYMYMRLVIKDNSGGSATGVLSATFTSY